jgi:hypothetical protein
MFSDVWSLNKKNGFALNEKTMGRTKKTRDLRIYILHITHNTNGKIYEAGSISLGRVNNI